MRRIFCALVYIFQGRYLHIALLAGDSVDVCPISGYCAHDDELAVLECGTASCGGIGTGVDVCTAVASEDAVICNCAVVAYIALVHISGLGAVLAAHLVVCAFSTEIEQLGALLEGGHYVVAAVGGGAHPNSIIIDIDNIYDLFFLGSREAYGGQDGGKCNDQRKGKENNAFHGDRLLRIVSVHNCTIQYQ